MHDDTGVCASTTIAGSIAKKAKLPPGGGRAAAGGTARARRGSAATDPLTLPKGTQWLAVTYVGGSDPKYRLQVGKRVRWVSGLLTLHDAVSCVLGKHENHHG